MLATSAVDPVDGRVIFNFSGQRLNLGQNLDLVVDLSTNNFPANSEVCDGADNNCDTVVDEGVTNCECGDGVCTPMGGENVTTCPCDCSVCGVLSINGFTTKGTNYFYADLRIEYNQKMWS